MDMLEPEGHFIGISPVNNFMGHGFYQLSPELYFRVFSDANGFTLQYAVLSENFGSAWYIIKEPAVVGEPVHLKNMYPTNMLLLARRDRCVLLFTSTPQQSDYVAQWTRSTNEITSSFPLRMVTALTLDRFDLYRFVYRAMMPLYALSSPRYRRRYFLRTTAEHLAALEGARREGSAR